MLRPHRALCYVCNVRYICYVHYTPLPHCQLYVQDVGLEAGTLPRGESDNNDDEIMLLLAVWYSNNLVYTRVIITNKAGIPTKHTTKKNLENLIT